MVFSRHQNCGASEELKLHTNMDMGQIRSTTNMYDYTSTSVVPLVWKSDQYYLWKHNVSCSLE